MQPSHPLALKHHHLSIVTTIEGMADHRRSQRTHHFTCYEARILCVAQCAPFSLRPVSGRSPGPTLKETKLSLSVTRM